MFSTLLGSAAGDLALTVGARGGDLRRRGRLRAARAAVRPGRLPAPVRRQGPDARVFLEPIPTWLVLRGDTGLLGAAHYRIGD